MKSISAIPCFAIFAASAPASAAAPKDASAAANAAAPKDASAAANAAAPKDASAAAPKDAREPTNLTYETNEETNQDGLSLDYDDVTDKGRVRVGFISACEGNPEVVLAYFTKGDPAKQRKIQRGPMMVFNYQTDGFQTLPATDAGSFRQGKKRGKYKFTYEPRYIRGGNEATYFVKVSQGELQTMTKADSVLRLYTDCVFDDEMKTAIKVFLTAPAFVRKASGIKPAK